MFRFISKYSLISVLLIKQYPHFTEQNFVYVLNCAWSILLFNPWLPAFAKTPPTNDILLIESSLQGM